MVTKTFVCGDDSILQKITFMSGNDFPTLTLHPSNGVDGVLIARELRNVLSQDWGEQTKWIGWPVGNMHVQLHDGSIAILDPHESTYPPVPNLSGILGILSTLHVNEKNQIVEAGENTQPLLSHYDMLAALKKFDVKPKATALTANQPDYKGLKFGPFSDPEAGRSR